AKWRSFKRDNGVGAGTIIAMAKQAGWQPEPTLYDRLVSSAAPSSSSLSEGEQTDRVLSVDDFVAYMPTASFVCLKAREFWPASSVDEPKFNVINLYRQPTIEHRPGDINKWRNHIVRLYGDSAAEHIISCLAHRV